MYLNIFYISVCIVLNIHSVQLDCGCQLNRNAQCASDNTEEAASKYTKEANEINDNKINQNINTDNMVLIQSATFEMGTDKPIFEADHEGPIKNITLDAYYFDKYEVSNCDFDTFVKETGYKTEAEVFGDSFIFEMLIDEDVRKEYDDFRAVQAPWWIKMKGVTWEHSEGVNSHIKDRMGHPVTHVSWNDARAYCKHVGKTLPTEAQWEMACRGGLRQKLYPWGNKLNAQNKHWANIWQGEFPKENTQEDGYVGTSPVTEYPPNKFGLHNMAGNVWEWTEDDWQDNPDLKVKKGGSYLCHESYCWRYRCAARSHNSKDSSAGNLGFRCAANVT